MINKRLLKLIEGNKRYLVYIILLNIFLFVLSISVSALICYSLSLFNEDKSNETTIIYIVIGIFLTVIIRFILSNLLNSIIQRFGSKILISLRSNFFKKLIKVKEFQNNEAIQLALEGIEQLNLYFTVYIPQFFYALISPILLFILFLFIDYIVALIFLICIPLIPLSIILVSKYAKKIFNVYWDKYLKMGGSFLDALKGLKELKLFKIEKLKGEELDKNNEEFRKVTMKVLIMQLFSTTIMDLVAYLGSAIGISVGIIHFVNGTITSPFLLLFIILVGAEFFLPLRSLGSAFHMAMNGETAGIKLLDIIEKKEIKDGEITINKITSIEFKNVDFKYEDDDEILLSNINLRLDSSNLYGICGLSGSGKSSFTKLVLKEEEPFKGSIIFNDSIEISSLNNESYFDKLSYISYDSYLFNKSILENFRLYNERVSEKEIYEALKMVRLSYLIDKNGFNYVIKEDANNLSGGEKQRLVLAIHLTKKKDLYIFDEATSNIDRESEEIIKNIIYSLKKDKSIILFISHNLENLVEADKILFIDENKINFDTFKNLISKNKRYKDIYSESIKRMEEIDFSISK